MKRFFYDTLYLALLGILSHVLGEAVPRSWFHAEHFPYRCMKWENHGKFYEKFHVRLWKDKVPDMSRVLRKMVPKRLLPDSDGIGQTQRLIQETCVAETTHLLLIPAGLVCLRIWPGTGGLVMFLLWTLGNIPFIIIQRYNRPRLISLLGRLSSIHRQEGACVI